MMEEREDIRDMLATVMSFRRTIGWRPRTMWIEFREMAGQPIQVVYFLEHVPFVRFKGVEIDALFEVRAEQYGKTWRCWDGKPAPETMKAAAWND